MYLILQPKDNKAKAETFLTVFRQTLLVRKIYFSEEIL